MNFVRLVAATAFAAFVLVPGAAADQSYPDRVGDATGGAPDITSIRVFNDASGTINFQLGVQAFPTPESYVSIIVDYDRNAATGDIDGDEFWFELHSDRITYGWRWNGTDWVGWVPQTGRGNFANGVWSASIHRSELSNASAFDFYVYSVKYSGEQEVGADEADLVYTYFLTQAPPPPQTPPPTPPQTKPKTADAASRLPSRIRYVGNSIKHIRIGENMYATMKRLGSPRVVAAACWSKYDWPSVLESAGARPTHGNVSISGFWLRSQPRWIHLSPKQCSDIQALISTRASNGQRAYALATALHERLHAEGIQDEAQTNCYAVQLVYDFARELNFVHTKAMRLEQLAVRKTRATAPRGYWNSAHCRDGGKWDLYAEFGNLNY